MSEKAVLRRLKQVDQLRDLCLSLMKAKPLTHEEAVEIRTRLRNDHTFLETLDLKIISSR